MNNNITSDVILKLRKITGAGIMNCKKALINTNGSINKSIEFLRETGLHIAKEKSERITKQGICEFLLFNRNKRAVIIEINFETDFIINDKNFKKYIKNITLQAAFTKSINIKNFLLEKWFLDSTKTVKDILLNKISIIKENIKIKRFVQINTRNNYIFPYKHTNNKICVLVNVKINILNNIMKQVLKNIAMQIAAMNPIYITINDIPNKYINKEKKIITKMTINEKTNINSKIINNIINGRVNKELKKICLLDQIYIKSNHKKQTVLQYINKICLKNNFKIFINNFIRFKVGENSKKYYDFVNANKSIKYVY